MRELLSEVRRIAVFGGVYNNHLALRQTLADARRRGAEGVFCLGDSAASARIRTACTRCCARPACT